MQTTLLLSRTIPILLILFILESNGALLKQNKVEATSHVTLVYLPWISVLLLTIKKPVCFPLLFVFAALWTLVSPSVWNQVWPFYQLQTLYIAADVIILQLFKTVVRVTNHLSVAVRCYADEQRHVRSCEFIQDNGLLVATRFHLYGFRMQLQ